MNQTQTFWNRSEKWLIAVCAIVVILGIAFIQWMRHLNDMPVVSIPTPTMPAHNAFDYFTAAGNAARDSDKIGFAISNSHAKRPYSADDHPYSQAEKERLVRENAKALGTLRQGFAYPYVNPPIRSFSTLLRYYAKYRQLARLLTLEGQVKAGNGDWNEAINSNLDAVQIGVMAPHGGDLIGNLVGMACEAMGRNPIWSTYRQLNAVQSRAAARRLEALAKQQVSFAETLQQEEWMGHAWLLEIFRGENRPHDLASLVLRSKLNYSEHLLEAQLLLTPKRRIMNNYTEYLNQAIAWSRQPYSSARLSPPISGDPLSRALLPGYRAPYLKAIESQTQNALLMTTLALQAYHVDHGAYPVSLAALVPRYLTAVQSDPFAASGPVRYRRTNAGYILYSVAPDGKDDGGAAIFDTSKRAPSQAGASDPRRYTMPDSKGDIDAGVNIY